MILSSVFGFISGIAIGSFLHFSFWTFITVLAFSLIFLIFSFFAPSRSELGSTTGIEGENKKYLTIIFIFLLSLLLGAARISTSDLYKESGLQSFVGQRISGEGIIISEPDVRETNTKLTIELNKISENGKEIEINENILVTVPTYPEFHYGDKVSVRVLLEEPKNIENSDGRVFDYKGYLRVRGIWYIGRFAEVKFIEESNGNFVKAGLFKLKSKFTSAINLALPEPESSLLGGLLLGSKQSLGKELLSEFQRTGTSHIVVLSGYNIAIVAESIMDFLSFLPKGFSFGIGVVSIILFTILSGGGASATRAAIMVLVALFAKKLNRDYKASRALGFAIVAMLAPNPLLLAFDPSFQLSILATIGLVFVTPLVSPYLTWVTEKWGPGINFREIVSSTIATQVTVLPLLIYNTGLVSLVSLPINVLVLGTIPLTMFLGFFTGLFGLGSLFLSFVPALFTYCLLWYQLKIIHIGSVLPFGAINLPSFSLIILVIIYLSIFTGLYIVKNKK